MNWKQPILTILIFAITAVCATSAAVCLDAFLTQQGMSDASILYASNALVGIAAATLVLLQRLRVQAKNQILEERIETLSEVNQHVRSVVTSLAFYGRQTGKADGEVLSEHLRRVEAGLSELFTRLLFNQSVPQCVLKAVRNTGIIRSLSDTSSNCASGANL
jgi:hypothetical protein